MCTGALCDTGRAPASNRTGRVASGVAGRAVVRGGVVGVRRSGGGPSGAVLGL